MSQQPLRLHRRTVVDVGDAELPTSCTQKPTRCDLLGRSQTWEQGSGQPTTCWASADPGQGRDPAPVHQTGRARATLCPTANPG